jgi:hypothetical protein
MTLRRKENMMRRKYLNYIKRREIFGKYLNAKERKEKKKRHICISYMSPMYDNKTELRTRKGKYQL